MLARPLLPGEVYSQESGCWGPTSRFGVDNLEPEQIPRQELARPGRVQRRYQQSIPEMGREATGENQIKRYCGTMDRAVPTA